MKNLKFIFFLGLLCNQVFAQKLHYGISSGYNLHKFRIENETELEIKSVDKRGLQIGAFLTSDQNKKLGFHIAPTWIRRSNESSNVKYDLNYLSLPLLIKYTPIKNISLYAGPETSYLLSAFTSSRLFAKRNITNIFNNRIDVGLNTGVSFIFFDKVSFDFRFYSSALYALHFTGTDDAGNEIGGIKFYNQGFMVGASYVIN